MGNICCTHLIGSQVDTAAIKSFKPTEIDLLDDPDAPLFLNEAAGDLNKQLQRIQNTVVAGG